MNNIANSLNRIPESEEDIKAQQLTEKLISLSANLAVLALSKPRCGCDKMLCSNCRRDKVELEAANGLKEVLAQFGVSLEEAQ
jgi:hypothetical protein